VFENVLKVFYVKLYVHSLVDKLKFFYQKINQSRYRPEVPRGFQEVKVPRLRYNGPGCGKVFSLTHRPLFTPKKYSGYSFLLEAESTPGPYCDQKDYVNEKFLSNQRPSDL